MFLIRRRSFIFGGSALVMLGSGPKALAQTVAAMTPHEKELYEAAKKEGGELTWYTAHSDDITAQILGRSFESIYPGIKVNSALPDGTSQQEVDAVKTENGTSKAPDVMDIGMAVALANTTLFAPYEVSTWSSIPTPQKASNGLWVQDYGGYMAVGYSSKFGTITSLSQLLGGVVVVETVFARQGIGELRRLA